jgi:hypothetical protein
MTRTIAVDSKNDLYIGNDGALALANDMIATMQAAQQAAQTQLGEMEYAVDQGIPNFDVVWNGSPNLAQFEAYLRRTIMSVTGVTGISELTVERAGGILRYSATIDTIYGTGTLNG